MSDWEWLRANAVWVELLAQGTKVLCRAVLPSERGFRPVVSGEGATEQEAIARCAEAARQRLHEPPPPYRYAGSDLTWLVGAGFVEATEDMP